MMTMVKLMRITLNQNHQEYFQEQAMRRVAAFGSLGRAGRRHERIRAHRRARSTPCPLELLPLENLPQSRTYQPAQFRVVLDDQDIPAPDWTVGGLRGS